ncbi:MAG: hypothetical protein JXB49_32340 [Bacteroidales bacterium]|nr:hypothetical protein [Bacteroidales bacterium]
MDIKQKRQRFNALLAVGQMMSAKEHILSAYGVKSTTELTVEQLNDAINRVEKLVEYKNQQVTAEIRKWRHKCLRMMNDCGVDTNNWDAVNAFMLNPRISGKHLYELDVNGLQILHRKLHSVLKNKQIKRQENERLALLN